MHPGVACPPSPLMIIDNDGDDDDEDDDDEEEEEDEPSVPLEQYRAWLGKLEVDIYWIRMRMMIIVSCFKRKYIHWS